MKTYPYYVLQGGFDGFGFVCWRRNRDGRKSGEPMTATTLDDLAGLVEHREAPRQTRRRLNRPER